ncbi:type-F conjugative transfer system protein TrbI [Xenorhabdus sp. XENO-1]|nr:type-F conjugative transfer system protein TrbI [Xenorhabdus bovienii subsp. africana]
MVGILACNVLISFCVVNYFTPKVVSFNMKKTVDAFFDSVSQKKLSEEQTKALSDRFNAALEGSLQNYQQKNNSLILVSPAVVQGAPDVTREIQLDIARRMKGE